MKPTKQGFTLLEVLVALMIAAIALGGLMRALGDHLRTASWASSRTQALTLARREMNAARRLPTAGADTLEGEEGLLSWTLTLEEIGDGVLPEELFSPTANRGQTPLRLEVVVEWRDFEGGPVTGRVSLVGIHLFRS